MRFYRPYCIGVLASQLPNDPEINTCGHRCSFSAQTIPSLNHQQTHLWVFEFLYKIIFCSPSKNAGGDCIFLFLYFLVNIYEWPDYSVGCWTQVSPGVQGGDGGFFLKEHQCQQTSWRTEDVLFNHKTLSWTSSIRVPIPTMCYCYQATHSGDQNEQARKLPPFTSYVQHHDSGKNRHSIISTKPQI